MSVTVGQAHDTILECAKQFPSIKDEDIEVIRYAVVNNLKIRDILMGLPSEVGLDGAGRFVLHLAKTIEDMQDKVPFLTVLSAYAREKGDDELSESIVDFVLELNPEYSLANLLKRTYEAGWAPENYATMRNELHPKNESELQNMRDTEI